MAEVRFLGCDNDVFCGHVQARAAEFEQASGHKLTVRLLDNDFNYANKLLNLFTFAYYAGLADLDLAPAG
jgi:hypothetical protein